MIGRESEARAILVERLLGEPIKIQTLYMIANWRANWRTVFFSQPIRKSPKGARACTRIFLRKTFDYRKYIDQVMG